MPTLFVTLVFSCCVHNETLAESLPGPFGLSVMLWPQNCTDFIDDSLMKSVAFTGECAQSAGGVLKEYVLSCQSTAEIVDVMF